MKLSTLSILVILSLVLAAKGFASYDILLCKTLLEGLVSPHNEAIDYLPPDGMRIFLTTKLPLTAEFVSVWGEAIDSAVVCIPVWSSSKEDSFSELLASIKNDYAHFFSLTNWEEATKEVMKSNNLTYREDFESDGGAIVLKAAPSGINYVAND